MKKNTYFVLASTALLLASCADDKFTGDGGANGLTNGTAPIAFNMQGVGQTRASQTGETAAKALNYEFIVWGEKNETSGKQADATDLVFQNYRVQYKAQTANTTTSNRRNWEYAGITPYASGIVSPSVNPTVQTIKYWDLGASSYTFTAVSAAWHDLHNTDNSNASSPLVKITKTQSDPTANGENTGSAAKGYTIELLAGSRPDSIYVSDRKNIKKPTSGTAVDTTKVNEYGGIAQLTFRNFMSKIRFGIYETVPGYKVVITGIKYSDGSNDGVTHPTSSESSDKTFGITGNFVVVGKGSGDNAETTKYTVTYESDGKAKVTVNDNCNKATYVNTTGTNWLSTSWTSTTVNTVIAESNSKPTYDRGDNNAGTYTTILPNPSNTTDMTLEISYDLYSEDTGEKISVDYKKAVVPAAYCKWKSNYAYTYVFKISDKSAELYPITFDAVVETSENGNQETITSVTEPSITTFGYDATNKKVITDKDEYENGNVIYASVVDESSATTTNAMTLTDKNIALYTVTATGYATITEASVADAIAKKAANENWSGNVTATEIKMTTTGADQTTTTNWSIETSVPDVDGTTRNLSALKWTADNTDASSPKYYAVEYTKTTTDDSGAFVTKKYYKIVKIAAKDGN